MGEIPPWVKSLSHPLILVCQLPPWVGNPFPTLLDTPIRGKPFVTSTTKGRSVPILGRINKGELLAHPYFFINLTRYLKTTVTSKSYT